MKSSISILLAAAIVATGVLALAAPARTSAQTAPEAATPTPTSVTQQPPAASPAPVQPASVDLPTTDEDVRPDDPAADEVTVLEEDDQGQRQGPEFGHGKGRNVVMVRNDDDGELRVRGRIRMVEMRGPTVDPVNMAFAYASCTDCQTYAVALEIVLVSPNASTIVPQNRARAINYECTRCVTLARALQYVFTVDDFSDRPDKSRRLIRDMERELRDIGRDKRITAEEANARVNAVIAQFQDLADGLRDQAEETVDPTTPGAAPPMVPAPGALTPTPTPTPAP